MDPAAVDAYLEGALLDRDEVLEAALTAGVEAGLPSIEVTPTQGKLLHLLARMVGARRILEIGTLAGYSTIWLARALPEDGRLLSLELDPHYAAVARSNLERAGLADRVEVRVGPALATLEQIDESFDMVFIDADKQATADYLEHALRLTHPGSVIVADNVIRAGAVADPDDEDPRVLGMRRFFERAAAEPRLSATAIQTVGAKGHDGLAIALVV
jgi:predicted O-methyltransferase YrrM